MGYRRLEGDSEKWEGYDDLRERYNDIEDLEISNPFYASSLNKGSKTILNDGKEYLNLSSYDYLGLSSEPRVQKAAKDAIERFGVSASAARIAMGERPVHQEFEKALAKFLGVSDCLTFPSGYSANVAALGHLFGPEDLIIFDSHIHRSCRDGIKLSGSANRLFRHNDLNHLEKTLKKSQGRFNKILILIEGLYSVAGDVAPVEKIIELKKDYGALLMIDEAHSFGTVGETGRGVREYFNFDAYEVDIWMGSLSKALGSMGGWIAGEEELIDYLRFTSSGAIFTAGLAPALNQAALEALSVMQKEPERISKLHDNAVFFYQLLFKEGLLEKRNFKASPIFPLFIGDDHAALLLSDSLQKCGLIARALVYPVVPKKSATLRFFVTAQHENDQLLYAAETIKKHALKNGVFSSSRNNQA